MPLIIGSIQLNQESIRIPELKRFLRPAGFQLQIACLYFIDCFVGVESGDSEVIVIEAGGGSLLLNSKETLADAEDVSLLRMLLKRHPKELLVELRGAVNVRNPHGDVIKGYGTQAFLLRRGLCAGDQGGQRKSELAAGHAATLEIGKHFFPQRQTSVGCRKWLIMRRFYTGEF